ncbi:MAG: NHL repeat-containing protein [Thermodesulfobacteriota bacterium]
MICCLAAAGALFGALFFAGSAGAIERGKIKIVAIMVHDEAMGRLKEPSGLFFDETKARLYVSDSGNNRLVSFDKDFIYLSEFSHEGFSLPVGLAKTGSGDFFVLDAKSGTFKFIDMKNKAVRPFEIKGIPAASEKFVPGRFTVDGQGNIYVIDRSNKRIIVADFEGGFKAAVVLKKVATDFYGFNDVRAANGLLYALDTMASRIYVFDGKGELKTSFSVAADEGLTFPASIGVGKNAVYVAYKHTGTIGVFSDKGAFQYVLAKKGQKEDELYGPSYIDIDATGRIYVIDGNRVQVFAEEK